MIDSIKNQKVQDQIVLKQNSDKGVLPGIQQEVLKESLSGSSSIQHQMLQLLANQQPLTQIQQVAQNQISKGYLDIKI